MTHRPFAPSIISLALALTPPLASCGDDSGGPDAEEVVDTTDTTPSPDTTDTTTSPDTTEPDTNPDTTEPDTSPDTTDTAEPDTSPDTTDTAETTPTECIIDGVTWQSGDRDPANACAACVPSTSTSGWTPSPGPIPLFDGALDHTTQGWSLQTMAPFEATLVDGALRLATTTDPGASTGGMALLWRALPLPAGSPLTFEVDLSLERASAHNTFDAGAAILMAYTPAFGQGAQRAQMVYLESARIGWADDSASAAIDLGDQTPRTFRVSIDTNRFARVAVDGVELLTRDGVENNGQIAIGDQTNDPNVDGAMRIRAVRLLCP